VSTPPSDRLLSRVVEQAQDLIYECDADGRFTYVNPAAALVTKYDPAELIGRPFTSILREDYREAAAALLMRQLGERIANTYSEYAAVAKTGETIWIGQHVQLVVENGAIRGVQGIARDISRQKETEERLRRSEEDYRSLVQGAAFGIYRSTEDGRILDANPALAQMLGYDSVDELLTHSMLDLYRSPEDRAALLASGAHRRHGIGEVPWKKKDGTPILVRLVARIVEGKDKRVTCYETIAEDVTERRALEEQLRQAQKMEAVGRLARGIAHDFNNVLAAIMGYSELITSHLNPDSAIAQDALEIHKTASRGAALTRQLLLFSRSQAMEPRVVDLHSAFETNASMLKQLMGPRVSVRVELAGPRPHVLIEPGQFEQVLMNLLVNARDAMENGGLVTVRIDAVELGPRDVVRYPGTLSGSYARISIRDTGSGIDLDKQPHIFEPFFTTKTSEKGTGLGLSIVYGIAKDAGGTVTFSTTPGKGTTFEVLLPLVK
jgi:two-component system, cell cycle sensor histidine kinase and response regulator CckA